MKKILFLLSVLGLLAFAVTNCDDAGVNTGGDTDTTQKSNPLAGEWYQIGSSYTQGRKVIFTDTTITLWEYANNYESGGIIHNYEIKLLGVGRYFIKNDTLVAVNSGYVPQLMPPYPFKSPITFHSNDTLKIQHFIPTPWQCGFPDCYNPITIYRR